MSGHCYDDAGSYKFPIPTTLKTVDCGRLFSSFWPEKENNFEFGENKAM